jgi:YihY family inner membrane protein
MIQKISQPFIWFYRVIGAASYRFYWDDCLSRAASLAYTTLLALIPITIIVFWIFNAFGVQQEQLEITVSAFLEQVLPPGENELLETLQLQIYEYINSINQNITTQIQLLGPASILVLVITSLALLNTIESALNVVWRVSSKLNLFSKFINFWAIVSLGPLLVLVSIYFNTQLTTSYDYNFSSINNALSVISFLIPVFFIWIGLTLLFYKLPAARVNLKDAAFGALIAAILFEVVKLSFSSYVGMSTTYSKLYGFLTTIPLFLLWLYLIWVVILLGAEVSYQAGSHKIHRGLTKYSTDLGEVGSLLGIRILLYIAHCFKNDHNAPTESDIAIETGSDPVLVRTCLEILSQNGLLSVADEKTSARTLARSPSNILIRDIIMSFYRKKSLENDQLPENSTVFLETIKKISISKDKEDIAIEDWTLDNLLT